MLTRKMIQALVLSAATLTAVPTFAATPAPASTAPCVLHQHQVTGVKAYVESKYDGRHTSQTLRGAEIFVLAEPGLTAEWLQLTIARHIAEMQTSDKMPNCPLSIGDVQVQVASAGTGFAVKLSTNDTTKAKEILRRAELLRG